MLSQCILAVPISQNSDSTVRSIYFSRLSDLGPARIDEKVTSGPSTLSSIPFCVFHWLCLTPLIIASRLGISSCNRVVCKLTCHACSFISTENTNSIQYGLRLPPKPMENRKLTCHRRLSAKMACIVYLLCGVAHVSRARLNLPHLIR
jgi:hypothetical protein